MTGILRPEMASNLCPSSSTLGFSSSSLKPKLRQLPEIRRHTGTSWSNLPCRSQHSRSSVLSVQVATHIQDENSSSSVDLQSVNNNLNGSVDSEATVAPMDL
ncbi:hypothetical protein KI387_017565, partial [Taxus chinensis]